MADLTPTPHVKSHLIPLSDFRTHIAKLLPRVVHVPERLVLTKHGRPYAAVVSIRDLDMIERFDARSGAQVRRELSDVAQRFEAAQEEGRQVSPLIRILE